MLIFELPIHPENQAAMARYMQDQFTFNGVKATERHAYERDFWPAVKQLPAAELMVIIKALYAREAREYQYVAIDIAARAVRKWQRADLLQFAELVTEKTWWDSVDPWKRVFSEYIKRHPAEFEWVGQLFAQKENFWLRRVGLILQLGFKDATCIDYLQAAIETDQTTPEFFIQKAIGWALRDYAKTNPEWVIDFVDTHTLSALAKREALKQL